MPPQQQTVEDLGKLVKKKYPGSYASLSDVEVGQKVKAKYPQYAQFSDVPSKAPKRPGLLKEAGQAGIDALAGVGSGVFSTIKGATELTRANKLLPPAANQYLEKLATPPQSTAGKFGKMAEQVGEYALPIGEEKLLAKIPGVMGAPAVKSGLEWLSRGALSAGRTAATSAVQSGSTSGAGTAGVVAGATTLLGGALGPVMEKLGSKIQLSKIKPTTFDYKDGFNPETVKKLGLTGNLKQSFDQVESKLGQLKTQRNSLIAPGTAKVDIGDTFRSVIAEAKKQAGQLKYGPQGRDLVAAIEALRDDTYSLLGLQPGYGGKVAVDVRVAENLKEALGTMGSWAYGHVDPASRITETAANSLYTGVKNGIESSLATAGPEVKRLNAEMGKLIPVKNAMLRAIPAEQRQSLITLRDIASLVPAMVTGNPRMATMEGLNIAQRSMRFGNWLVRNSASAGKAPASAAGRIVGGAVSPRGTLSGPTTQPE